MKCDNRIMRKKVPDQVLALRKRANLSLAELARRMGYRRASSIQRYESATDFRGDYLAPDVVQRLAGALVGIGTPPITEKEILVLGGPLLARTAGQVVPLISRVQAGEWAEAADPYPPGGGYAEITADMAVGPRAYALEIEGESMLTRFQPGDRIIVDPDVLPIPGDFVVAKLANEQKVTFKQYRPRGRDSKNRPIIELRPLNDDWPIIPIDAKNPGRIIATMIEHRSYRRKSGNKNG